MKAVTLLCLLGSLCAGIAAAADPTVPASDHRPGANVVMIVADDFGPDLYGAYAEILLAERDKTEPGCAADPNCRPDPASTPHLDRLAEDGMLFTRCWANPFCSPTRAQIMTGRHAFRNGIGRLTNSQTLRFPEPPLAWRLSDAGYVSVALGKWHLQQLGPEYDWTQTIRREIVQSGLNLRCPGRTEYDGAGFDFRLGSTANLNQVLSAPSGAGGEYGRWEKNVNGVPVPNYCRYATVDTIDDAIALLDPAIPLPCSEVTEPACRGTAEEPLCGDFDLTTDGRPWFLYVALNAPHAPFHDPDPNLCPPGARFACQPDAGRFKPDYHRARAMTEVLDAQVGRLLARIDLDETYVILVGDNGTANDVIAPQGPYRPDRFDPCMMPRAKGSLYEGGLRVPLVIAGPGVRRGSRCDALTGVIDLFATVCDLAGADGVTEDSVSLVPYFRTPDRPSVRETIFAERFDGLFDPVCGSFPGQQRYTRALRNERYKLIRTMRPGGPSGCPPANRVELYDLENDPFERANLLAQPDKFDNPEVIGPADDTDYCALRCEMIRMGVDRERPGDLCNCCVGLDDLAAILTQLGCEGCGTCTGDQDRDCDVDLSDLATALQRFGQCE